MKGARMAAHDEWPDMSPDSLYGMISRAFEWQIAYKDTFLEPTVNTAGWGDDKREAIKAWDEVTYTLQILDTVRHGLAGGNKPEHVLYRLREIVACLEHLEL
jgi:hypothetical protein